jgi:hypothetical protein
LIEPKYDGIRAQIHKKENEVRIFTDGGERIEDKFPHLVREILSFPQESFILDGELVKYKGNSRLSYKAATYCLYQKHEPSASKRDEPPFDSHFKLKLFDLLYLNGEGKASLPLERRKKLLGDFFPDTHCIQKVKYEGVLSGDLPQRIKSIATSEGAMIKNADSGYFEGEGWYKWKRNLELDVLVRGVEENKGGTYNYECGLGARYKSISMGKTYSTPIQAKVGDIIRVRIDYLTYLDDRPMWHAPKVLDKRSDKKEPDPVSVLERIAERNPSAENHLQSASKESAMDGGQQKSIRFVLQLHWWGEVKHHDLRFQKEKTAFGLTIFELDLDELNQGKRFLCEWKDYHDPKWMDFEGDILPGEDGVEGNPSRKLVAHMRILDRGEYQMLKSEKDISSFKTEGEILKGVYLVRRIKLNGKDRWLFWKRSADGTD